MTSVRRFLVVSNSMRTDGGFLLDDVPGTSGRADVIARSVVQAFLTSNGIRRDVLLHVVCTGPPDPPKALRFTGEDLRHLNPDERTTAALLQKALRAAADGLWRESTPGIHVRRVGLELVEEMDGPFIVLSEEAPPFRPEMAADEPTFVLGDHRGLTDAQADLFRRKGAAAASLGPVSLHTDQCIVVVHNLLDNAR